MGAIEVAAQALITALGEVQGIRVFPDVGAGADPPAAVLGPPALTWEGMCVGPTSARWLVSVVVPSDDRAIPALMDLVPRVAAALDTVPDAVVIRADPGSYPGPAGNDLPAYQIQVDVAL